ncbi:hypothetical protein DFR76_11450 [Nocardia pseudobrasiliensis]|uniref:Uncharacterized protein n=1 Tax=Nocardia pseudobrasiliensis TaxID=45979 RepID=A0A370HSM0_9NOCA|nr:hypothetical protein DFR76_11450 [Nocardia pseudobrasiliensis]
MVFEVYVSVAVGNAFGVVFEFVDGELFGAAADSAQQVVVMTGVVAEAVEEFTVLGTLSLHHLFRGEAVQDSVHAGEADAEGGLGAEFGVELLGTAEAVVARQQCEQGALALGAAGGRAGLR